MSKTYILSYLNVPDAFNAGGVDVGVVGGGDAARGLPPQDAAATVHHPLKSARNVGIFTGFSSEIGTKLRASAVGQAGGSCYSRAALSSNDSKTLYLRRPAQRTTLLCQLWGKCDKLLDLGYGSE